MPINKGYFIPKSLPPTRAGVDRLREQFRAALERVMAERQPESTLSAANEKSLENEALKKE